MAETNRKGSDVSYLVVGGNPFRMYTGTVTFTHLRQLGVFSTEQEAHECVSEHYDDCSGLIEVFLVSGGKRYEV